MKIKIETEYIKLDQLLKFANLVESGALAKRYIQDSLVYVNDAVETRRGKKLRPGDKVRFENEEIEII